MAVVVAPTSTPTSTPAPGHLGAERPTSTRGADRVEQLVGAHDCWTGAAPADVVPRRAVVTLPGHRSAVVDAEVGFEIWLEDAPGELHAFCR